MLLYISLIFIFIIKLFMVLFIIEIIIQYISVFNVYYCYDEFIPFSISFGVNNNCNNT